MVVDCAAVKTGCMLEKYVTSPLLLLSFASIAVAAVEKGYAFLFLVEVLLLLLIILLAALLLLLVLVMLTTSVLKQRGTGYCFFLLHLCPLHCDASDVYCCCCSWLLLINYVL